MSRFPFPVARPPGAAGSACCSGEFDARVLMGGSKVFGPWFTRQGDFLRAACDVVENSSATMTVKVYTKAYEDTGDGQLAANTTISFSAGQTGVQSAQWGPNTDTGTAMGLEDLVRFQFHVTSAATTWILFRMLQLTWHDLCDAT